MISTYNKKNFYFWESRIKKAESILVGNIDNKSLTKESVIIYLGILDKKKGVLRAGWSCYEDINSALGFLQHVFIPTSYYTWIDRESEGFYIPLSPFNVLKTEVLKNISTSNKRSVKSESLRMERGFYYLNNMWKYDNEMKKVKIKEFCKEFNEIWDQDPERRLFVKVIDKCDEIPEFIMGQDEFLDIIEEEIEMSIEEFKFMCENAYDEPLINRNLINLLNSKIPIWF